MAEEINELAENAEHGHEGGMAAVTITMAILAVLVAIVALMSHRTHTEEILLQTKASDQWAYYQAKDIRRRSYELFMDETSVFAVQNTAKVEEIKAKYEKELDRYKDQLSDTKNEATGLENEVHVLERRVDRFDLGEVLLEAALVICSITLLTKNRIFWLVGVLGGIAGVIIAVMGFMVK
jgi:hypothetical protein